MISRQHETLVPVVPQREREHAAEPLDAARPPFDIGVEQRLGIGTGAETMAPAFQLGAQFAEIVDLAVEHQRHAGGLMRDRLVAGREVDDGETAVAETDRVAPVCGALEKQSFAVGAAMADAVGHRLEALTRVARLTLQDKSGNSAHAIRPPAAERRLVAAPAAHWARKPCRRPRAGAAPRTPMPAWSAAVPCRNRASAGGVWGRRSAATCPAPERCRHWARHK